MLVLAGIALSLWRRMRDEGALTLQTSRSDFLPLILLFAISVTGLALTVSQEWLRGAFYGFLAILHAITVIARSALSAVREVLPHLPASGATRGEAVPVCGRPRRRSPVRALRRAIRVRACTIDDLKRVLPRWASIIVWRGRHRTGRTCVPPASESLCWPRRNCRYEGGIEWLKPRSPNAALDDTVRPASQLHAAGRLGSNEIDGPSAKLVKTHCCFCGQQCGIQLKVRDNHVIGFEPWEDFPFNRGMLCPKGVKRYLQGNHPDRLLDPLLRHGQAVSPGYMGRALDFTAQPPARNPGEVWARMPSRFTVARRSSRKRRTCWASSRGWRFGTRHIDYNGRLCMVSAGTAYKLAFGVDRSPIPGSEIPKAEVLLVIGANIGECAPITTDYHLAMPRQRRQADRRRSANDADLAQRRSVPARAAGHRSGAADGDAARDRARRARGPRIHRAAHHRVRAVAESVEAWDPAAAAEMTRRAARSHREGRALDSAKRERAIAMHARGLEHQSKGVENCLALINLALATGNIGARAAAAR